MLNMTTIDVVADGAQPATVTIEIDLGQSLLGPAEYWAATQLPKEQQAARLDSALRQLDRQLEFLINGEVLTKRLERFEIAASSEEAIRNPLTPQMAMLYYQLDVTRIEALQVRISEQLQIPWPALVKITIDGALPQSRLLTDVDRLSRPVFANGTGDAVASLAHQWWQYAPSLTWIAVGFQHIIPEGLDHILFILGLFFLSGGWRPLLIQVTGFTLAHSITLGLSMYGVIHLPGEVVEPLIALSIVYVALDNLFATRLARWRLFIVMMFGLLHGLGFAAVLSDIGLPEDQFLLSLGLFNLGVELGQLAVLGLAFIIVGWFRRQDWYAATIAQPAAIAIAGTGLYWFLKRITF